MKAVAGGLELSLECYCSATIPKTRIKHVSAMAISAEVKAKDVEANPPLCAFLTALFGGVELKCEVVRGQRAPVKVVRVEGSGAAALTPNLVYHKLQLAAKQAALEAASSAPPRLGRTTFS